jgi:hypothetical protein
MVRTSSTDAFSCLPPQRTIAYTENSLSLVRARREIRGIVQLRCELARLRGARPKSERAAAGLSDAKEYQTPGAQLAAVWASCSPPS